MHKNKVWCSLWAYSIYMYIYIYVWCTFMCIDVTNTYMYGKVYNGRVLTKFLTTVTSDIGKREWDSGIEGGVEVNYSFFTSCI